MDVSSLDDRPGATNRLMTVGRDPRLLHATSEQRAHWQIAGAGFGIHWPDVDEDLSTEGILRGAPAPRAPAATRS